MAKRLIDATEAKEWAEKHILDAKERYAILDFLRECSTVDAVEVVRCRDCKFAEPYERVDGRTGYYCLHPHNSFTYGQGSERVFNPVKDFDDFCSYGERKEG